MNSFSRLPDSVDSSRQFSMYKDDTTVDVTYDYFKHFDKVSLQDVILKWRIVFHHTHQFRPYSELDYENIIPVVRKYFSPSEKVHRYVDSIKQKYKIDCNNCIAVYYRGTDKATETQLCDFDDFYSRIKQMCELHPDKKVLVQSDSATFLDYMMSTSTPVVIVQENDSSYSNKGIHNVSSAQKNYTDMFFLFSTFLIISKCKYIICSSGNCSLWMMLYRGNGRNVLQYLSGKWHNSVECEA